MSTMACAGGDHAGNGAVCVVNDIQTTLFGGWFMVLTATLHLAKSLSESIWFLNILVFVRLVLKIKWRKS